MSITVMSTVWKEATELSGAKLLLLLALADRASDEGYCWPSYVTLAKKARVGKTHVIGLMKELVAEGWVKKAPRFRDKTEDGKYPQTSNIYLIQCPPILPKKDGESVPPQLTTVNPPSSLQLTPPVNPRLPNTSYYPSFDTSINLGDGKSPSPDEPTTQETEMDVKEYQERIAQKLCAPPPMEANGLNVLHVEHYPADVQKPIILFCQLWNIRPPAGKGKKPGSPSADWIEGTRELIDACGEIGVERVLREYRHQCNVYAETHGGCHPFSVNSPRSLAKTARGIAGQLREKAEREKVAPVMTSDGGFWA